jgi:hypothetical protein
LLFSLLLDSLPPSKELMKFLTFLLVSCLSACAATTGVVAIGNETYSISHRDNGPMASLGALKAAAYKDAAAFCAAKNRALQVVRSNDVPRSFGQFPETEVQFNCV